MPRPVGCDELGRDLPLPQLSVHDFRAEAARSRATATAGRSPAPVQPRRNLLHQHLHSPWGGIENASTATGTGTACVPTGKNALKALVHRSLPRSSF